MQSLHDGNGGLKPALQRTAASGVTGITGRAGRADVWLVRGKGFVITMAVRRAPGRRKGTKTATSTGCGPSRGPYHLEFTIACASS